MHVAAAEAIDRLLRVANEHQRRPIAPRREHATEDRPLARIGVLEFVDQGDRVLRAELPRERIGMLAIERIGDAIDQVVVGLHPALPLEPREARAGVVADAVQQRDATARAVVRLRLHRRDVRRNVGAHRRCRHQRVFARIGLGLQRFVRELRQARVQRCGEVPAVAPCGPLLPQRIDPVASIAASVEHLGIQRRQQRGAAILAMLAIGLRQCGAGRLQCRPRVRRQRRSLRQQHRLAQQQPEVFGKGFMVRPQRTQIVGGGRVLCMRAPQVGGKLRAQVAIVCQQFGRIEAVAGFQRVFAQHARAEAVDGEDRGEVDVQRCLAQPPAQRFVGFFAALPMRLQQLPGQRGFAAFPDGDGCVNQFQRQLQPLADALAQFLGGRIGEGDREDLADAQPAFHHQPRHQRGEGVGLAGAGAGLDQAHAVQRQVEVGVADAAHASSSASSGNAVALMAGPGIGSPRVSAP